MLGHEKSFFLSLVDSQRKVAKKDLSGSTFLFQASYIFLHASLRKIARIRHASANSVHYSMDQNFFVLLAKTWTGYVWLRERHVVKGVRLVVS
jgi:hypothetical protein